MFSIYCYSTGTLSRETCHKSVGSCPIIINVSYPRNVYMEYGAIPSAHLTLARGENITLIMSTDHSCFHG